MRLQARISHHNSRQLLHALLYLRDAGPTERRPQHPCSRTAMTLCRTLHDFSSVRELNIVLTMPAHSSVAKGMHGTTFRHLSNCSRIALLLHIHVHIATNGGEKYGLAVSSRLQVVTIRYLAEKLVLPSAVKIDLAIN